MDRREPDKGPAGVVHLLVSGQVQGVGFRWSTMREARRLGARGWVRNLRDGRVEILAEGSVDILEELEAWVERGPPGSRVEKVEKLDVSRDIEALTSFEII